MALANLKKTRRGLKTNKSRHSLKNKKGGKNKKNVKKIKGGEGESKFEQTEFEKDEKDKLMDHVKGLEDYVFKLKDGENELSMRKNSEFYEMNKEHYLLPGKVPIEELLVDSIKRGNVTILKPKEFGKGDKKGLMEFVEDLDDYVVNWIDSGKRASTNKDAKVTKNVGQGQVFVDVGRLPFQGINDILAHAIDKSNVTIGPNVEPSFENAEDAKWNSFSCTRYKKREGERNSETFTVKKYDVNNKDHVYEWYKHLKTFPLKRENGYGNGNMITSSDVIKRLDGDNAKEMAENLVKIIIDEGEKQENEEDDRDVLDKIGFILILEEHGDKGGRTGTKKEGVDCYGQDVIPEENFDFKPFKTEILDTIKANSDAGKDFERFMENHYYEQGFESLLLGKTTPNTHYTIYTLPPFPTKEDEEIGVEKSYDGGKKKSRKNRKNKNSKKSVKK